MLFTLINCSSMTVSWMTHREEEEIVFFVSCFIDSIEIHGVFYLTIISIGLIFFSFSNRLEILIVFCARLHEMLDQDETAEAGVAGEVGMAVAIEVVGEDEVDLGGIGR